MIDSKYQRDFYAFVEHGEGSAVLVAVAGSGKTTSILNAIRLIPPTESVQLFAYNTEIATTLKEAVRGIRHVQASTFHSVGYWAVCTHFGMKNIETNGRKLQQICREKLDWPTRQRYESFICKLVGLAKGAGVGCLLPDDPGVWEGIVAHHDLYLDDPHAKEAIAIQLARTLLAQSNAAAEENYLIDFDDQLYLTILWNLGVVQKDWVFVDEAQDTNAIRRAIIQRVLKPGGRLIAVGDPKQAIYGFTGASHDAIDLIKAQWECIELPLSVCYRCPTSVVEKAKQLVPYIEAWTEAPAGSVEHLTVRDALKRLTKADAVLCRNNAPLVDLAYACLGQGLPCRILGRDIGKNLQILVDKMQVRDLDDLLMALAEYRRREVARLLDKDQHSKAQSVADRVDCLNTLIDHLGEQERTIEGLKDALDRMFGDQTAGMLTLSTVHKAKGKEWPQVAILKPELMPAPWAMQAWEQQQEEHVMYVAWTRAKETLIFLEE